MIKNNVPKVPKVISSYKQSIASIQSGTGSISTPFIFSGNENQPHRRFPVVILKHATPKFP